ncbi:MAG: protein kinase, partial [Thermoanaerobaculia bacterium]|nr:protein kinase [Thermoanaerobaculia bacterium]
DTRLGREVAIKVLPDAFVEDAERLARFQREAQLLASLNHPNIGGIYGLEEDGATRFLVLELIPGETLAERLARGPVPPTEALPVALQLAHALEAAHARGIVHRDLKPANIKLTPGGTVKVLDFGLAKAWDEPADSGLTHSPTLTAQMTLAGVILGTASYMSPEQARGKPADKRADIWSFGVVLFEMLAGGRVFGGETVTDILGAIVHKEPEWERLPTNLPRPVERLLRRCLEKDRTRRLQHIGDARIELEEAIERGPETAPTRGERPSKASRLAPWVIAASALVLLVLSALLDDPPLARYTIALPEDVRLGRVRQPVAISPDGSKVVYEAFDGDGWQLFERERASGRSRPIEGTSGGHQVTFSPDGNSIAFRQGGSIRKLSLHGGTPLAIVSQPGPMGIDWTDADEIVYTPDWGYGLRRISTSGGEARVVTELDPERSEGVHFAPHVLPGGEAVVFTTWESLGTGLTSIAVAELPSGDHRVLIEDATTPVYSPTGHLLFVRAGTLMAVPFDADRLEVTGQPLPIQPGVRTYTESLGAVYAISDNGTLVFQWGGVFENLGELIRVTRDGEVTPALDDRQPFAAFELSPDGRHLAVTIEGPLFQIWIYDLESGSRSRLTGQSDNGSPSWLPDGREIVFWSTGLVSEGSLGPYSIVRMAVDGRSEPVLLHDSPGDVGDPNASPRGDVVVFEESLSGLNRDLTLVDLEGDPNPRKFLSTADNEEQPAFSPDGRWIAYQSDESGRDEVYVAEYPGPGASWLVSAGGGRSPRWSLDGRELYYRWGDGLFAVSIDTGDGFRAHRPGLLFELSDVRGAYDVARDGFLMIRAIEPQSPYESRIEVVLNWPRLLEAGSTASER